MGMRARSLAPSFPSSGFRYWKQFTLPLQNTLLRLQRSRFVDPSPSIRCWLHCGFFSQDTQCILSELQQFSFSLKATFVSFSLRHPRLHLHNSESCALALEEVSGLWTASYTPCSTNAALLGLFANLLIMLSVPAPKLMLWIKSLTVLYFLCLSVYWWRP
jgi:hypothetical protein